MNVTIESKDGMILARVDETQIGADAAEEFKTKILEKLPAEKGRVAIDLSKVEFMDSSGLGALVSLLKTVRPGGELILFGMCPSVQEILRLTHLDSVFRCETDEAAAMAGLTSAAAS